MSASALLARLSRMKGVRREYLLASALLALGGYLLWPFVYPYLYLYLAPTPTPPPLSELSKYVRHVEGSPGMEGASIYIPSIKLRSGIVEGISTEDLLWGVGHLPGSSVPGRNGNIVLTGHNYVSGGKILFTLLHRAKIGDQVILYQSGKRHLYEIAGRKIVPPHKVEVTQQTKSSRLTLITCYPPGTTRDRLVLTAKPLAGMSF